MILHDIYYNIQYIALSTYFVTKYSKAYIGMGIVYPFMSAKASLRNRKITPTKGLSR